jgi:hypothetical protein
LKDGDAIELFTDSRGIIEATSAVASGFSKKVLEYAQSLNATKVKGKSGKDLLKFAGTFDQDNLKVMEEAIQYGCE